MPYVCLTMRTSYSRRDALLLSSKVSRLSSLPKRLNL
ncbi:hypothetical protein ABIB81_008691 [Bradyrhizobium sp. I1.7.5]